MKSDPPPNSNSGNRRTARLSVAFCATFLAAVAVVSFLPPEDKRMLHSHGRFHSWGHLVVFSVVGFLAARTARSAAMRIAVFFGGIFFGFLLEAGEHIVFHSPLEWKDVFVDALGVLAGTLLALASTRDSRAPEQANG